MPINNIKSALINRTSELEKDDQNAQNKSSKALYITINLF